MSAPITFIDKSAKTASPPLPPSVPPKSAPAMKWGHEDRLAPVLIEAGRNCATTPAHERESCGEALEQMLAARASDYEAGKQTAGHRARHRHHIDPFEIEQAVRG